MTHRRFDHGPWAIRIGLVVLRVLCMGEPRWADLRHKRPTTSAELLMFSAGCAWRTWIARFASDMSVGCRFPAHLTAKHAPARPRIRCMFCMVKQAITCPHFPYGYRTESCRRFAERISGVVGFQVRHTTLSRRQHPQPNVLELAIQLPPLRLFPSAPPPLL